MIEGAASWLLILLSYLSGAIPFGFLICRFFFGVDIRELGSGNIGATNVLRSVGKLAGALVLTLDVAKGFLPVCLAQRTLQDPRLIVLCAAAAILGHSRSLFLGFKGGKSVATGLGTLLGIAPLVAGSALALWLLVLLLGRFVSLASLTAAILLPLLMLLFRQPWEFLVYGTFAGLYVVLRHRSNLRRLLNGTEPRIGQHAAS